MFLYKTKNPAFAGFVRIKGLEPPRLSTLDPKSSAATNYAISAIRVQRYMLFFILTKIFE